MTVYSNSNNSNIMHASYITLSYCQFQDIIATKCTSLYVEGINHIIDNKEIEINLIQNTHL